MTSNRSCPMGRQQWFTHRMDTLTFHSPFINIFTFIMHCQQNDQRTVKCDNKKRKKVQRVRLEKRGTIPVFIPWHCLQSVMSGPPVVGYIREVVHIAISHTRICVELAPCKHDRKSVRSKAKESLREDQFYFKSLRVQRCTMLL